MTEVIAVRRFWWEDQPDCELLVIIGKPSQPPDDKGEFYCPIQTSGFGNDGRTEAIFGCDAFHAVELAMRYIEHRLSDIDAKSGGRLRWQFGDEQRLPPEWALREQPPDLAMRQIPEELLTRWAESCLAMNHLVGTLVQRELRPTLRNARAIDLAERARRRAWQLFNELVENGAKKPEGYQEPSTQV